MSLSTRLDRITPVLSGQECAMLVLQSMKVGQPEDPRWPPEQYHDFKRCIRLINAATQEARVLINLLEDKADCLELREGWLVSVTLWNEHVQEIRDALPPGTASRPAVHNLLRWKPADVGEESISFPALLRRSLGDQLAYHLICARVELSSLETVVDEITAALGGEDLLLPASQDKLESTKQRLPTVHDHLLGLDMEVVLRDRLPRSSRRCGSLSSEGFDSALTYGKAVPPDLFYGLVGGGPRTEVTRRTSS